ncbi:MAG TPA: energy transducer TonB, partial [Candidatus Acidoferrales bacterium]|nr:energy transducer TonB [Candidatus Acidoferrales bacterium]
TDTGRLVREERLEGEVEKEYSEYIPWGGKVFPGVLRTTEGGKRVVEMRVEEISANASPDPAIYQPPPGSEAWAWCNNPDRGRVLDRVQPVYPAQAKLELRSGKVSVYAVIGVNGRLTNLRIARSAGPDLDNATLDAVKRWRYRPTSCNGVSIRDEVVIDVVYSFQR